MLDIDDLGSGDFSLHATGDEVNDFYEARINGNFGDVSLDISMQASDLSQLTEVDLKLAANGPRLGSFVRAFGVESWPDKPFQLKGEIERIGNTLNISSLTLGIGSTKLKLDALLTDFPNLDASRIKLSVSGDDISQFHELLGISGAAKGPFKINSRLDVSQEEVELVRVDVENSLGRATLSGTLGPAPDYLGSKLHLHLEGNNARTIMSVFNIDALPDLPFRLDTRIEMVENGLLIERGVLVTIEDEQLELGGFLSFNPGSIGTDAEVQFSGQHLNRVLQRVIGDTEVPDQPYLLSGRVRIVEEGIRLENVKAEINDIRLTATGLVSLRDHFLGTGFDFQLNGQDLSALGNFAIIGDSLDIFVPGQSYQASGQILLSNDTLSISGFEFETARTHGNIDLELGWPVSSEMDAGFNVNIGGDDIRHLLSKTDVFEPEMAAYKIKTVGRKRGDMVTLQNVDADIGNLQIKLKGKVDDDLADESVDITFSVVSSDLSTLGRMNGDRLPAMPLDLKADFKGNIREFVFHNITGTLGESHIAGTLDVSLNGPKPEIKLIADSNYIDSRPFMELADADNESDAATSKSRLIPATPLPLDALAAADITIKLNVAELRHPKDSFRNLVLKAETLEGSLIIPRLSFKGPRGELKTSLSITPTGNNKAEVKIDLNAKEFVFNLSGQPDKNLHEVPATDVNIHVSGKGDNLQEVAGSINGSLHLGSKGGKLEGVNLSVLDTFILDEIFSLIMPKTETEDDLNLTCAATILNITDGLVKTDPAFAFTTDRITLIAKGTLDLKTEKMKINFNAIPNNALKISAGELFNPYILVGGTLSSPEVGLDPAKVLLHGGAAVGTAGISILAKGLVDRLGNTVPVCEDMLEKVQQKK